MQWQAIFAETRTSNYGHNCYRCPPKETMYRYQTGCNVSFKVDDKSMANSKRHYICALAKSTDELYSTKAMVYYRHA
jgi:hypothetical protein